MWPLEWHPIHLKSEVLVKKCLRKHTDPLFEQVGLSRVLCNSLWVYALLHVLVTDHITTTMQQQQITETLIVLMACQGKKRRHIQFWGFEKTTSRCVFNNAAISGLSFCPIPDLRLSNQYLVSLLLTSLTWKASRSFPLKSMMSEEPVAPFSPGKPWGTERERWMKYK